MVTMREAIHANCFECSYDPLDAGTKHQHIENCQMIKCHLHPFRPVTNKLKATLRAEKITGMSPEELAIYEKKCEESRIRLAVARNAS